VLTLVVSAETAKHLSGFVAAAGAHDLRYTYGSLLVAGGIDLASVKPPWATPAAPRPSAISTPDPHTDLADTFTQALSGLDATTTTPRNAATQQG
jgi:hypothetical protein